MQPTYSKRKGHLPNSILSNNTYGKENKFKFNTGSSLTLSKNQKVGKKSKKTKLKKKKENIENYNTNNINIDQSLVDKDHLKTLEELYQSKNVEFAAVDRWELMESNSPHSKPSSKTPLREKVKRVNPDISSSTLLKVLNLDERPSQLETELPPADPPTDTLPDPSLFKESDLNLEIKDEFILSTPQRKRQSLQKHLTELEDINQLNNNNKYSEELITEYRNYVEEESSDSVWTIDEYNEYVWKLLGKY